LDGYSLFCFGVDVPKDMAKDFVCRADLTEVDGLGTWSGLIGDSHKERETGHTTLVENGKQPSNVADPAKKYN